MTRRRLSVCALLLVVVLGACGTGEDDGSPDNAFPTLAPQEPEAGEPGEPGDPSSPPTLDPSGTVGTEACAQVRAGIDAFNEGDFDETVERFAEALPPAEDAAGDPNASAEDVLLAEAIRYYAELRPQEYAAAPGTPEFETNKQITLGLCVTEGAPLAPGPSGGPDEPGVEA